MIRRWWQRHGAMVDSSYSHRRIYYVRPHAEHGTVILDGVPYLNQWAEPGMVYSLDLGVA